MKLENVVIIGGGPAGLSAAIYLSRAMFNPLVIAGSPPGGQLMLTSEVENYPGYESILGSDLIVKIRSQAEKFGTRFVDDNIVSVDLKKQPFKLFLSGEKEMQAQSILIASGASALWLGLDSETRLRGKGVSACATCDGFFFRNKIVAVIGGGDTAMEEASFLSKFADKIYLIHRRNEFKASKIMQKKVFANKKIEILWNKSVVEVLGDDKVTGLKLIDMVDKKEIKITIDGLFLAIGHKPNTGFLKNSGIILDQKGYVKTASIMAWEMASDKNIKYEILNTKYQNATSVSGVFASGDCVDHIYRQAAVAVGAGVAAALDIEHYLSNTK